MLPHPIHVLCLDVFPFGAQKPGSADHRLHQRVNNPFSLTFWTWNRESPLPLHPAGAVLRRMKPLLENRVQSRKDVRRKSLTSPPVLSPPVDRTKGQRTKDKVTPASA
jgi:hypothetical protein